MQARFGGGGVINRRNDGNKTVFFADFYADTAELSRGGILQFAEGFFVEVNRVRVQIRHHTANGVVHELTLRDFFDITLADLIKDIRKAF